MYYEAGERGLGIAFKMYKEMQKKKISQYYLT